MKFFICFQTLVFCFLLMAIHGCGNRHEKEEIQGLIDKNLAREPRAVNTLLSIKFGDSRTGYLKKMDSLYQQGIIHSFVSDPALATGQDLSYYRYYYIFPDNEAVKKIKWIFSPVFKNNRLIELELITNPVLEQSLMEKSFELNKGILKNIIETSEAVMEDAAIIYRITKAYFISVYGTPEFVSENSDISYWFRGNCVISVSNNMTMVKVKFKNSELK